MPSPSRLGPTIEFLFPHALSLVLVLASVVYKCAPTAVKFFMRLWLQKFVPTVGSHSLGRVQGMVYIVLSMSKGIGYGYRVWVILCCAGLRVQGMVYIVLSMSKGAGHGFNYWL